MKKNRKNIIYDISMRCLREPMYPQRERGRRRAERQIRHFPASRSTRGCVRLVSTSTA